MKSLVSIIVPTYGRSDRIEKCIESLLNQSYKNIEIIIVDDNGENKNRQETKRKLKKYEHLSNIVFLENKTNKGACYSRNKAILNSKGRYITFLDDDDIYYPFKIEKQVGILERFEGIDFVVCNMKVYNETKKKYVADIKARIGTFFEFSKEGVVYTNMLMVKREALLSVELFSEIPKFQDKLLVMKLLAKEKKFKILNEALIEYTVHDKTITNITNNNIAKYRKALKVLQKIEMENKDKLTISEYKELKNLKNRKYRYRKISQEIEKKNFKIVIKEIIKYVKTIEGNMSKEDILFVVKNLLKILLPPIFITFLKKGKIK